MTDERVDFLVKVDRAIRQSHRLIWRIRWTMEINDETKERLERLAEEYAKDFDELSKKFQTKYAKVQDNVSGGPDLYRRTALRSLKSELSNQQLTSGGGQWVETIAVGHEIRQWNDKDNDDFVPFDESGYDDYGDWSQEQPKKDVLIGNAVIYQDGISRALFVIDETNDLDLGRYADLFEPPTPFKIKTTVNNSETLSDAFRCWSTDDTDVELNGMEYIPEDDEEARMEILRNHIPKTSLSNITEGVSATEMWDGREQVAEFGVDVRRINASVEDFYLNEAEGQAVYTIHDDSILDESELEGTPLDSEEGRVRGLTCWCRDTDQLEFGPGSICDFFGIVRQDRRDDGAVSFVMDLRGIYPILPEPVSDGSAESENVETETF